MSILEKHDPNGPSNWEKEDIKDKTDKLLDELYEYSKRLIAESKQSILLVLQGMDASGKDGLTRQLFQKSSAAWVNVHSFKKPTDEEYAHDFLWRIHQRTPAHGKITVFNRSHYEDILVPSVYGYIDQKTIDKRYQQINDFEKYLEENGTRVVKIYLNLSYEKQGQKLQERIDTREKHWKHSDGDWDTREKWSDFMKVYETLFERCNVVPWHIVPCNTNWAKLYSTLHILVDVLKEMNPQYPDLESDRFTPDYTHSKITY